jgi:hypothetical protein
MYAYTDRCRYYEPPDVNVLDEAGHPTPSDNFVELDCALNDTVARLQAESRWNDFAVITEMIAEVHLRGVVPHVGGQIVLIERSHIPLTINDRYEILAIREQGAFGYLCALKNVSL